MLDRNQSDSFEDCGLRFGDGGLWVGIRVSDTSSPALSPPPSPPDSVLVSDFKFEVRGSGLGLGVKVWFWGCGVRSWDLGWLGIWGLGFGSGVRAWNLTSQVNAGVGCAHLLLHHLGICLPQMRRVADTRIIHPTPYTLHPAPYTPHPTHYSSHPTPYTLHPTPYTLQPAHLLPHHLGICLPQMRRVADTPQAR